MESKIVDTKLVVGCDLVRGLRHYKLPESYAKELEDIQLVMFDPKGPLDKESLKLFDIYLGDRITPELVGLMPKLAWIHLTSIGLDKIEELKRPDIIVTTARGLVEESVAEHALSLMFAAARGINHHVLLQTEGKVDRYSCDKHYDDILDLTGKKCLIVGLGNIGKKIQKVCEGLSMTVTGIRKSKPYPLSFLPELVSDADVVYNVLPLNSETIGAFDMNIFIRMKPTVIFINVGRSETVVSADLVASLKEKKIKVAGLDVFDGGQLSELCELSTILTPHVGSYSPSYWSRQLDRFLTNLKKYQQGHLRGQNT